MASLLELHVQIVLNGFPNGVTVGTNDHGASNGTVISELGGINDVEVPSIEVLRPRRDGSVLDAAPLAAVDSVLGLRRRALCRGPDGERRRPDMVAPPRSRRVPGGDGGREEGGERRQSQSDHHFWGFLIFHRF